MGYCTQADIIERLTEETLIQITDDTDAGTVNESVVTTAIEDADSEVNGYAGKRYAVPLSPVPPLIRKLSVEIAIYNLYSRRLGAPEEWQRRYRDNTAMLRDLAKGLMKLEGGETSSTASDPAEYSGPPRAFSRELLKDW